MNKFTPYDNEADVLRIGRLAIENRLDRITLSGDLDLTADRGGLADAKALLRVLTDAVAHLEAQELPATLPPPTITKVANPFG